MIKGIVCVSAVDWGIGKNNSLLFNLPADMKFFRKTTNHNIVVFGKSTYDSLSKRPLPGRINVVLWDQTTSLDCLEGTITFNNFYNLLNFVQILSKEYNIYICGGASIYKLFLPYYDEVVVTKVDAVDNEATVFFPNLDELNDFKCIDETEEVEDNGYKIKFVTYERIK